MDTGIHTVFVVIPRVFLCDETKHPVFIRCFHKDAVIGVCIRVREKQDFCIIFNKGIEKRRQIYIKNTKLRS